MTWRGLENAYDCWQSIAELAALSLFGIEGYLGLFHLGVSLTKKHQPLLATNLDKAPTWGKKMSSTGELGRYRSENQDAAY